MQTEVKGSNPGHNEMLGRKYPPISRQFTSFFCVSQSSRLLLSISYIVLECSFFFFPLFFGLSLVICFLLHTVLCLVQFISVVNSFYTWPVLLVWEMFLSCFSYVFFSSSRGWRGLRGPGEWYELFAGEPVHHLQCSADRVHPTTAQRTVLVLTPTPPPPPPSSSYTTQPAKAGSPLALKPYLPRAALLFILICGLTSNWSPTVTTHAHPCC